MGFTNTSLRDSPKGLAPAVGIHALIQRFKYLNQASKTNTLPAFLGSLRLTAASRLVHKNEF